MRHVQTPSRTDTGINFSTWMSVIESVQKLSNLKFDPTKFIVQDYPSGMFITIPDFNTSSTPPFTHRFQMTANVGSSFVIADGSWYRDGIEAKWSNASCDPKLTGIISSGNTFTGDIYTYVVRKVSDGDSNALEIVLSGNPIPGGYNYAYKCEELIGTVHYTNGNCASFTQSVIGDISDLLEQGGDTAYKQDQFGLRIQHANTSGDWKTSIYAEGGDVWRNEYHLIATPATLDPITSDKKVYIKMNNSGSIAYDPSIIPVSPAVIIATNYPSGISGWDSSYIPLFEIQYEEISLDATGAGGGSSGKKYPTLAVERKHEGGVYDQWIRPDGIPAGIASINVLPSVQSIDVNSGTSKHRGELQDAQVYENLVTSGRFRNKDAAFGYYNCNPTGATTKGYCYLDTEGRAAGHTCGMSLEISGDMLQIKGFLGHYNEADLPDNSYFNSTAYLAMCWDGTDPANQKVSYIALDTCKWNSAATADYAYSAGQADVAGYASSAGTCGTAGTCSTAGTATSAQYAQTAVHMQLSDLIGGTETVDQHTWQIGSNFSYLANNGNYLRNKMTDGLGDSIGGTSVAVSDHKLFYNGSFKVDWSGYFLANSTETTVDWGSGLLKYSAFTKLDWQHMYLQDGSGTAMKWDRNADGWFLNFNIDNSWDKNNFKAHCSGSMYLNSDSDMYVTGSANIYLNPNASSAGSLYLGNSTLPFGYIQLYSSGKIEQYFGNDYLFAFNADVNMNFLPSSPNTGTINIGNGGAPLKNINQVGSSILAQAINWTMTATTASFNINSVNVVDGTAFGNVTANINLLADDGITLVPVAIERGWIRVK